jgi:hypothetical protein
MMESPHLYPRPQKAPAFRDLGELLRGVFSPDFPSRIMKKHLYAAAVCLTVLLLSSVLLAQDKDWRPVDPEDLKSTKPLVEPDADAEALFYEARIDDSSDSDVSTKYYIRVKIYTERGQEKFSKFDIPFIKGIKIKDLAARVIKPDGSIVEISKDDIFEREIVKASGVKIKAKSFAVPNIQPGVIVEYRYKETISDAGATGRRLEFQRDIPARSITYYYKPYAGEPVYRTYNTNDVKFVKDKGGYYIAQRTNVPAFREERNMPPEDMVKPWVRLGYGRSALRLFGKLELAQLLKDAASGDVKKTATEITQGASSDDEKIAKLYEFCQTQISNTTFDPTLTDELREKLPKIEKVSDVLKRKQGSTAWIDLLFGAMALSIKLDAHVAYIGDRSKMFITPDSAIDEFLHPGAIAVKVGGDWKFYNPGTKFLPMGQLVWYEEENWAQVVSDKGYEWVKTPYTDYKGSARQRAAKFKLADDGTLEGDVKITVNGQPATEYRMDNYDEAQAKLETQLTDDVKRNVGAAELSSIRIDNVGDAAKPLTIQYHVKIPNYAQKTGKRLFLQPNFFEYGDPATFAGDSRKYDMYFRYAWSEKDNIEIEWPAGYTLDNADTPGKISDPQNIGSLEIKMGADTAANFLRYQREFHFGGGGNVFFKSNVYTPMKNLFDAFNKADTHTISLKQK